MEIMSFYRLYPTLPHSVEMSVATLCSLVHGLGSSFGGGKSPTPKPDEFLPVRSKGEEVDQDARDAFSVFKVRRSR